MSGLHNCCMISFSHLCSNSFLISFQLVQVMRAAGTTLLCGVSAECPAQEQMFLRRLLHVPCSNICWFEVRSGGQSR